MAPYAERSRVPTEPPPLDPTAVDRAYRYHRAKRHARVEHRRERRRAGLRFWAVGGMLLLACLVLGVTIWDEITRLFGL
jgi:hypothetical protein